MIESQKEIMSRPISIYLLTSEGIEIKRALGIETSSSALLKFGKYLKEKESNDDLKITVHRIIQVEGDTLKYEPADLLD